MKGKSMRVPKWRTLPAVLLATVTLGTAGPASAAPEGTMTWGVHITLASRWLDPAETEGIITPFMVLYGLHDAPPSAHPRPSGATPSPPRPLRWREPLQAVTMYFLSNVHPKESHHYLLR